jgi:hypothetical protein
VGVFDRAKAILGTENEAVLKRAVDPQIAYLYGTVLRSVPTFFLLDDHDYFENDTAMEKNGFDIRLLLLGWRSPFTKGGISFPPDDFMLDAGRSAQKLYLPEFLPAPGVPADLPGSGASDRAPGVNELYGALRYGTLLEALLFESRRFTTLTGPDAVMIHPQAEKWLTDRMQAEEARHILNLPPTAIDMQEKLAPVEKNGFVIVDVYPEEIRVSFYAWRQPEPEAAIDTLEPYHVVNLQRK